MFTVFSPTTNEIRDIQDLEQAYYWSACASMILRKNGFPAVSAAADAVGRNGYPILTRSSGAPSEVVRGPCFCEGPLHPDTEMTLGLRSKSLVFDQAHLTDASGAFVATAQYSRLRVRRIPSSAKTISEPYEFVSSDPLRRDERIRAQTFVASDAWEPLLFCSAPDDDTKHPVVVTDGSRIVSGLPILDLLTHGHGFPPLSDGYFSMITSGDDGRLEEWLMEQLIQGAIRSGGYVARVGTWPAGFSSALTVRHDYDRLVAASDRAELLDRYAEIGVSSTWGLLVRTADAGLTSDLASMGHEVALHTEAADESGFLAEVDALEGVSGIRPRGYSAHGGAGSPGFLGETQYGWAERAGLAYGEILGRSNRLPHRACVVTEGVPGSISLMLPTTHDSLDRSMGPNDHFLDGLRQRVPERLKGGEHVVVMNHPDIHQLELLTLLKSLDLTDVWKASLASISEWADTTKYSSEVSIGPAEVVFEFPRPLEVDTECAVQSADRTLKTVAVAGARSASVALDDRMGVGRSE